MAIEEKVVQSESVTPTDQSVTETPSQPTQPNAPDLTAVKTQYEEQIAAFTEQRKAQLGEDKIALIDTLVTSFNFSEEKSHIKVQVVEQNTETASVQMKSFSAVFNPEGFLIEGHFES